MISQRYDIEMKKRTVDFLNFMGRFWKYMSWDFNENLVMEKLTIVNESHNIINIIYDDQS